MYAECFFSLFCLEQEVVMTMFAVVPTADVDSLDAAIKEVIFEACGPFDPVLGITGPLDIQESMTLVEDLGAWSIDFLDLEFKLQQKFKVPKLATEREHIRLRDDKDLRALITAGMVINRVKEKVQLGGV